MRVNYPKAVYKLILCSVVAAYASAAASNDARWSRPRLVRQQLGRAIQARVVVARAPNEVPSQLSRARADLEDGSLEGLERGP